MRIFVLLFFFPFLLYGKGVLWIPLQGEVEWGMASFLKRGIETAEKMDVEAVVLEISTFGGRLDSVVDMKETLLNTSLPTYSFINPRAISAGSLIALATDKIYILPRGTIGAATPVSGGGEVAGEKVISFVRSLFRATAEAKGHSPFLAEAFVDPDAEIVLTEGGKIFRKGEEGGRKVVKVISPRGKLLTLTGKEALEYGLAEGTPGSKKEFLKETGLLEKEIITLRPNWGEKLARVLTSSTVASLLFSLGILGILFELTMPGWGISGTIGSLLLLLFFTGKYFAGLAQWVEILLFLLGIALLLVEIFLLPGFGIAGISGIILLLLSLYLSLVKHPLPQNVLDREALQEALYSLSLGMVILGGGFLLFLKFLPQTPIFSHLGLSTRMDKTSIKDYSYLLGKKGKAITPIRPVGKAKIGEEIVDVVSEGEFLEKGREVEVIQVEGVRIVVRGIDEASE